MYIVYIIFLFFRLIQSNPPSRAIIVGLIRFGHRRRFRCIRSATHLWRQPWVPCIHGHPGRHKMFRFVTKQCMFYGK